MSKESTAEIDAPTCKGSMRSARRLMYVHGTPWGVCRACGQYWPLNLAGSVKPHRTTVTPSG